MDYVLKDLEQTICVNQIANVHFFEFPKDFYTKAEKHPFYELVFVSSGYLDIVSDYFNGKLKKGQLIIHKPNEYHSLSCENKANTKVIIVGFTCNGKQGYLDKFSSTPVAISALQIEKLGEIVKEGRNIFLPPYDKPVYDMKKRKHQDLCAEQMLKITLEYFLLGLIRDNQGEDAPKEEVKGVSATEIINYLNRNYKEKITIDELSFIFKTNRSTLCKIFKNATKKTVVEYTADKKIEEAKNKIINTDKTLSEIAEELNFESIHYFTRLFTKKCGISPKKYRTLNKK